MSTDRAQVYVGGRVHILDGQKAAQDALAVRGGLVIGSGSRDDMIRLAGKDAQIIDVDGQTVMPGLIDTHPHLLHFAARAYALVDLSDARDHDDIVARLRKRAESTKPGEWIVATPVGEPHYFIRRNWRDLAERRLPDRWTLDRASTDHPIFIEAWGPTTPNVCAFNSTGLKRIGITSYIPDQVCQVWIDKDDKNRPTGLLRGAVNNYYSFDPFWSQIQSKLPGPASWNLHDSTAAAMAEYNAKGVTAIYEAHNMRANHIRTYKDLHAAGRLTLRVSAALESESYAYPPFEALPLEVFLSDLKAGLPLMEFEDEMLRVTGASFSPGGPLGPGAIRMHEPYKGPFGEMTRGITFLSREKQDAFVDFCVKHNLRGNFVVAGYRDTDDVIDGLVGIADSIGLRERKWLVQHALVITEKQATTLADLGFQLTTSMSFSWGKGDVYGERVGEHVWRDQVPLARLLKAGLTVGCGSDWGPKNPWEHIKLAETHEFCGSGHHNDTSDHVISRDQSLRTWTQDAGIVIGRSDIGTLGNGKKADFIIADRDPTSCPLDELPATRVFATAVGGRFVYNSGVADVDR